MPHYTEQQIEMANNTSLVTFLYSHGERLKKVGMQYLWEKHQVWIRDNRWYTHYDAVGGYAIGFVMKYYSLEFQDAVAELIGEGYCVCNKPNTKEQKPKELVIPKANTTMNRVYAYLMNERFISHEVIWNISISGIMDGFSEKQSLMIRMCPYTTWMRNNMNLSLLNVEQLFLMQAFCVARREADSVLQLHMNWLTG